MSERVRAWPRLALVGAAMVIVVGAAAAGASIASAGGAPPAGASGRSGGSGGAGGSGGRPDCRGGSPKVTVTGTGVVSITPNLLTLSLDIHSTAPQASAALSQNDAVTAAMLKALKAGGLAAKDLQTTDLTIEPNYASTGATVSGYGVDDTVVAKIRKFATAGTLIDAAVRAGGNDTRIDSLAFSLTRPLRAQARARAAAVRQAVSHARAIAASSGGKVTGICSINDRTTTTTTTPPIPYERFGAVGSSAGASTPVQAGSQTVTARVTMVFALR